VFDVRGCADGHLGHWGKKAGDVKNLESFGSGNKVGNPLSINWVNNAPRLDNGKDGCVEKPPGGRGRGSLGVQGWRVTVPMP